MKRALNPAVMVCFPLVQVMSFVGFRVGMRWANGRAYGFCSGSRLVWNRTGPVAPDSEGLNRVYPKLNTLMRFDFTIHVYCAAMPLLLSRSVEAGVCPGNCSRI